MTAPLDILFLQDNAINESLALCDVAGVLEAEGHRTRLLLEYWSGPDGDGALYNADGTFKEPREPYIAPKIKRRYTRDEL